MQAALAPRLRSRELCLLYGGAHLPRIPRGGPPQPCSADHCGPWGFRVALADIVAKDKPRSAPGVHGRAYGAARDVHPTDGPLLHLRATAARAQKRHCTTLLGHRGTSSTEPGLSSPITAFEGSAQHTLSAGDRGLYSRSSSQRLSHFLRSTGMAARCGFSLLMAA